MFAGESRYEEVFIRHYDEIVKSGELDYYVSVAPAAALRHVGRRLPQELVDRAAKSDSVAALIYASSRLSPSVLAECARQRPCLALKRAVLYLPEDLTVELARREPVAAMIYASNYLPDKVFDEIAPLAAREALDFRHKLSDKAFAKLSKYVPSSLPKELVSSKKRNKLKKQSNP